jgi:hypothetical protein
MSTWSFLGSRPGTPGEGARDEEATRSKIIGNEARVFITASAAIDGD